MTAQVETIWGGAWLVVIGLLLAGVPRLGKLSAASWLAVLGIALLAVEEPLLTLFFALADPALDRDGLVGIASPQALAHVSVASAWAIGWAALLVWTARRGLRQGKPEGWLILLIAFVIAATAEIATIVLVSSRGLALPTPGGVAGAGGIGWQPVSVGMVAWGLSLVLSYSETFRKQRE